MEPVALFNYGGGGGGIPRGAGGKMPPPCLAGGCGGGGGGGGGGMLANHTGHARHNHGLANTIYKVTPTPDEDKYLTPNSGGAPPCSSPLASPASPAKDKVEAPYGTLRKEAPTLKPVPPPTLPPAANTPTHTPMLTTRAKKTVTICDSADGGRAGSPLSPGRI